MNTKRLGSNGPEISVIGYGAWELGGAWGTNPPEDEMIGAIRAGFDAGITWVDTAEVYGNGSSEEIVSRALDGYPDVLVFTKVAPKPNGSGFDRDGVRAGCEASLKRLGRDVVDLYQCHWPDENVPLEETWSAMAQLVDDGLVRWIGVSNFNAEQIERCEKIRHVDSLQPQFSILHRGPGDELLPFCARNGTGVIAYGPLAFGLLTGAVTMETTFEDGDWRANLEGNAWKNLFQPSVREKHLQLVGALRPIADRKQVSLAELALAWVWHQPGVTGAIAGTRRASHVRDNAKAGDLVLSEQDLAEIGEVIARAAVTE
ncbi:MAG: aldo/keto reductase [Actinomycetota bacterium]|nr:aldo/keto reductase [Actinomycetota bacterium]